jgi:hypothetical protein
MSIASSTRAIARVASLAVSFALVACSSGSGSDTSSGALDDLTASRRRPPVDAGAPFPAFAVDAPKLVPRGGPVLAAPQLRVVTFAGDPQADDIETFASRLGASSYWRQATHEYGVGAMTFLPPIRLAESAPAAVDDSDFRVWLASKLDGSDARFGSPDPSTIYAVFYPTGTKITIGTQLTGCVNSGGYHWDATMNDGTDVPYVVMPRCTQLGNVSGLDVLTMVASHELAETATDPLSQSNPAFFAMDDAHFAFGDYYEAEDGDLCVQDKYLTAKPSDVGYTVQRLWSNAAAAAGHHPCVPSSSPYFTAQPVLTQTVNAGSIATRGVSVALHRSKTIDLQLFSDAPTSGAWTVTVYDVASVRGSGAELSFALDRSTGQNGDVLRLTITRNKSAARGFSEAMIWSHNAAGDENFWPFIVGD